MLPNKRYPTSSKLMHQMYRKYVPNIMDDSLSLYEQMIAVIEHINNVVKTSDKLSDEVSADMNELITEVNNIRDFSLPENVIKVLTEWHESGYLNIIINENLQTQMDDYEAKIDQELVSFNQQLAQTEQELTSQLQQKADYTLVRKKTDLIGVDDFTPEAQAAIAGSAPIANSIPANDSVTLNTLKSPLREEYIAISDSFDNKTISKNIYDKRLAVDNKYYNAAGAIFSSTSLAISGLVPVEPNQTYTISIGSFLFDFIHFWNGSEHVSSSTAADKKTSGTFTTPENATHLSFNINFGRSHTPQEFEYAMASVQLEKGTTQTEYQSYQEIKIVKSRALPDISTGNTRHAGKRLDAFGDSITAGTKGGYLQYVGDITNTTINNRGQGGARTTHLVGIMTDIKDRGGSVPSDIHDYTNTDVVTIQIGTNENPLIGQLSDIPQGVNQSVDRLPLDINGQSVTTESEYWALFPNNFYGNLALCIEYVKYKNPNTLIYLITPYLFHSEGLADELNIERMKNVRKAIIEIGELYSVPVIDAQTRAGVDMKHLDKFVYDGTHLNEFGNKVWGTYIGYQLLYN